MHIAKHCQKSSIASVAACAVGSFVVACSGAPGITDQHGDSNEPAAKVSDAIRGGTPTTRVGVVALVARQGTALYECTGILLNRFTILTAAHCFPKIAGGSTVPAISVSAIYQQADGTQVCLTGGTVGRLGDNMPKCDAFSNYTVSIYPGFIQDTTDAAHDLAVAKSDVAFSGVTPDDYAYINADSIPSRLEQYGYGENAYAGTGIGTLRMGSGAVDAVNPQHINLDAGGARVCNGDSGGPATIPFSQTSPQLVVEGLLSNSEGSGKCAPNGGLERYTRLSPKIDFISSASGAKCWLVFDGAANDRAMYRCFYPPSAIQAIVNGLYVTAEDAGASPLIARASQVGDWEKFELIDNLDDGTTSFVALINSKLVTAEDAGASPLIARASQIGTWERFRRVSDANDSAIEGLVAVINGKFVTAEDAGGSPLIARADVMGPWEQFQIQSAP